MHSTVNLWTLLLLQGAAAGRLPAFRHEAVGIKPRQADDAFAQASDAADAERYLWPHVDPLGGPPSAYSPTAPIPEVLTFVTPSPGATPVAITTQSQLVASYVPEFTLCALPPEAFFPITATPSLRPSAMTMPYRNYSVSVPPSNGTCTIIYSPTVTMVCATVLEGIATKYTVSECDQEITFSSDYGYVLVTPTPTLSSTILAPRQVFNASSAMITPAPTIETLTTYYIAPWAELTTAGPPADVEKKICATYDNGTTECVHEFEVWQTSMATVTTTSVTSINLTTTIQGPSQIIIETFVANITEYQTQFSLSTTMALEYIIETETTSTSKVSAASAAPTVTQTWTLEDASST